MIEELRYWPKDAAIPDGWEMVNDLSGTHHGNYSVLIRRWVNAGARKQALQALKGAA